MKKQNKAIYEQIMRRVSKEIKRILNEDIQRFDISNYNDEDEIINNQIIDSIINEKYVFNTNILWSDLNVYTLYQIKKEPPETGYPIGVNVIDNKYVSLKYMLLSKPQAGSKYYKDITFSELVESPDCVFHDNLFTGNIDNLQVIVKRNRLQTCYKPVNNNDIISKFKCFDGKAQTQIILNDVSFKGDYDAAECVNKFRPGDTKRGDWYLPEIGELAQIYILKPVIDYICVVLKNKGFNDIYDKINNATYWSSTFYDQDSIYYINMDSGKIGTDLKHWENGVLAMYQLKDY